MKYTCKLDRKILNQMIYFNFTNSIDRIDNNVWLQNQDREKG